MNNDNHDNDNNTNNTYNNDNNNNDANNTSRDAIVEPVEPADPVDLKRLSGDIAKGGLAKFNNPWTFFFFFKITFAKHPFAMSPKRGSRVERVERGEPVEGVETGIF